MKGKYYILISNIIIVGLVLLFVLVFKDFENAQTVLSFVFLLLTLLTPTLYTFISNLTLKNSSLSNVLWLTIIPTGIFVLANIIACSIMMSVGNLAWKTLLLTEALIIGIYAIILTLALLVSNYIKEINKEK